MQGPLFNCFYTVCRAPHCKPHKLSETHAQRIFNKTIFLVKLSRMYPLVNFSAIHSHVNGKTLDIVCWKHIGFIFLFLNCFSTLAKTVGLDEKLFFTRVCCKSLYEIVFVDCVSCIMIGREFCTPFHTNVQHWSE